MNKLKATITKSVYRNDAQEIRHHEAMRKASKENL